MIIDKTTDYKNNSIDQPIYTNLVQGENIFIQTDGKISAKDDNTLYSAGVGLDLTDGVFSIDSDTVQSKLTAGSNITIANNVISASGGSNYHVEIADNGGNIPATTSMWRSVDTQSVPTETTKLIYRLGSLYSSDSNAPSEFNINLKVSITTATTFGGEIEVPVIKNTSTTGKTSVFLVAEGCKDDNASNNWKCYNKLSIIITNESKVVSKLDFYDISSQLPREISIESKSEYVVSCRKYFAYNL